MITLPESYEETSDVLRLILKLAYDEFSIILGFPKSSSAHS